MLNEAECVHGMWGCLFPLTHFKEWLQFSGQGQEKWDNTAPLCNPPGSEWIILHGRLSTKPATAQCRSGSTLVTLLRVTDVHENCTSTRPYTTKHRDKTEKTQGQEPVSLQPREFWLVAGNPHCCRMCFGLIITTSGKNIQVDIITSVFLFDDCCFTRN